MVRVKVAPKNSDGLTYFDLIESETQKNTIELVVTDSQGNRMRGGTILKIDGDGTITRQRGVNPDLGLPLDESNRVKDYYQEQFKEVFFRQIKNIFRNM